MDVSIGGETRGNTLGKCRKFIAACKKLPKVFTAPVIPDSVVYASNPESAIQQTDELPDAGKFIF